MKTIARFALVVAMAAGAALAVSPAAQPPGGAKAVPTQEQALADFKSVELLAEAYKLKDIAEAQNLPEVYVASGRLFLLLDKANEKKKLAALDATPTVQTEDGKPVADAKLEVKPTESYKDLAGDCFDRATTLAEKQKRGDVITKLIASIEFNPDRTAGERGALGGPKTLTRAIGGNQTHTYTINFDTFTPGAIGFQATAPLRCKFQWKTFVHFDQVVRTGSYTWQPAKDIGQVKTYVITVHNHTKMPAEYRLFTN